MTDWASVLEKAQSTSLAPKGTLVICGAPKATLVNLRMTPKSKHALAYTNRILKDDNRECLGELGAYWLDIPDPRFLEVALKGKNTLVIICLNWHEGNKQWPVMLKAWLNAIREALPLEQAEERARALEAKLTKSKNLEPGQYTERIGSRIVLAPVNYYQMANSSSTFYFKKSVLHTHQLIRTIAYQYGAAILSDSPSTDWLSFLSEELELKQSLAGNHHQAVTPNVTTDLTVPSGWDTKARILATDASFPIDDVLAGNTNIPDMNQSMLPEPKIRTATSVVTLKQFDIVAKRILEFKCKKNKLHGNQVPGKTSNEDHAVRLIESSTFGDRKAISGFFDYIMEKSMDS